MPKWSRRTFLTSLGLGGGLVAARSPLAALGSAETSPPSVYREAAGFVILPEGAPLPAGVPEQKAPPITCAAGGGRTTAISSSSSSDLDLAGEVDFPVYTLLSDQESVVPLGGEIVRYPDGTVHLMTVGFETADRQSHASEANVRLLVQPGVRLPYALHTAAPVERGNPGVTYDEVDFLPAPGLETVIPRGAVFRWLEADVLFTFVVENGADLAEARGLAQSLARIG